MRRTLFGKKWLGMDLWIAIGLFLFFLVGSVVLQVPTILPVILGMLCFSAVALHRGYTVGQVGKMIRKGAVRSLIVIEVVTLIGVLTALWRASGTIPYLIYYSIKFVDPKFFVLFAFFLTGLVSYMLGSSFGAAGTIGAVLMVIARSSGVSVPFTAGAVLSGAYWGDRTAPTSSCAVLVASLTDTELYDNVKRMWKTGVLPLLLTLGVYAALSFFSPQAGGSTELSEQLSANFHLSAVTVMPAVLILVLPLFKIEVKKAVAVSAFCAALAAVFVQKVPFASLAEVSFLGFHLEGEVTLDAVLGGGGIASMWKAMSIVLVSSTYAAIFEETKMLSAVENILKCVCIRVRTFTAIAAVSVLVCAVTCNQTLAIMLVEQLFAPVYDGKEGGRKKLAVDISNSAVLLAGLIPWSVACTVPLAMMGADLGALPYACLLYLIPLCNLFAGREKRTENKGKKDAAYTVSL